MQINKILVLAVAVCFSTVFSFAQKKDSLINKSVTVEREFIPDIPAATPADATPTVVEPQRTLLDAVYSDFNAPLSVSRNVNPLSAATLMYASHASLQPGYARLAFGFYPNTLADFAYPLIDRADMRLDAVVKHRGVYNDQYYMETAGGLSFDKYFSNWTLFVGVDAG